MESITRWAVVCRSARTTANLAARIAGALTPGCVLALRGELGAGKTCFVQGLARGLGVTEPSEVVSPTFALVNEYPTASAPLVHIDLYRLESQEALFALGIEEQLRRRDAVVAVEWADMHPELFGDDVISVQIELQDLRTRRVVVEGLAKPRGLRLPTAPV